MTAARHPGRTARRRGTHDEVTRFDWDELVARWWERRVVVFRGVGAPFTLPDAFAAAVAAGRRQLGRTYDLAARGDVRFSIDGQSQAFLAPWVPVARDRDFTGYAARLAGALGDRCHALIISRFHSQAHAMWAAERAMFAPLWQRVGLPLTGAITTLFHGDYEATPTGVHRDRFTTLLFALAGRKRMRFWPVRPWTEPVTTMTRYDAYLATSFAVEVGPGDVLYWPSSYFHIGESAGGMSTSVNVGIPIDQHRAAYVIDDLVPGTGDGADLSEAERRRDRLAPRHGPLVRGALAGDPRWQRLAPRLPPPLAAALAELQRRTAPRTLAAHTRARWRAQQAAGGFEPVPAPGRPATRRRSRS
jgi:50S ribosomal protein L16 3-hydroxylase